MKIASTWLLIVVACMAGASCGGREKAGELIVVQAPVEGEVRRVLVSEGAAVREGAVILEIAAQPATPPGGPSPDQAQGQARAEVEAGERELEAAEAEAERAQVEVQRVEQLVASGFASPAELDAARGQSQQAQQRLDEARQRVQRAGDRLTFSRGQPPARSPDPPRLVAVRAPASGSLRAITARPGQRVTQGQPLATLSTEKR